MAKRIHFSVVPSSAVGESETRVVVEATYSREQPGDEGEAVELVSESVRIDLDAGLKGSADLEDAGSDRVEASLLAADGSSVLTRTVTADSSGNAVLTLQPEDLATIVAAGQAVPAAAPATVLRRARFVPTGTRPVDFRRSRVVVAPVIDAAALTAAGVDALLHGGGTKATSIDLTGQDFGALRELASVEAHLAVDGTLTVALPKQKGIGWLWWLTGDQQALGFVVDDLAKDDKRTLAIALPTSSAPKPAPKPPSTSIDDGACAGGRPVPADVTETELAENPDVYSEDPGAYCRPFSNPERVLSEKAFAVIARVTQPAISPVGSAKAKTMKLMDLEGDTDSGPSGGKPSGGGMLGFLGNAFGRGKGSASGGVGLVSLKKKIPLPYKLPPAYLTHLKALPSGRTTLDANHPLQWEHDISRYQAATVALGHLLEFRVRWRSNGYSLGTVAKTLTLAPRQTKRIQKIEWERSERARRSEFSQLRDQENDSTVRERDYQDHVSANLSEWSSGGSSSAAGGIAGGIGFAAPPVVGGVGGGAGGASSSSHAEGGRSTTASEHQRLRDAIRRHGDALRKFESTVVTEVTQEETVTGTTEVIRNANYAHSLTVIYYQILRHLKVTTEFAGAREVLFVPFAVRPFDIQRAYRWREPIQLHIRAPRYSRALRYLKDVATDFATSDILPGPRAGQPITFLRGSIYVSLGVERPRDAVEGVFNEAGWQVLQPFLESSTMGVFGQLAALGVAQRDGRFQSEYAPRAAARWADTLKLRLGTRTVEADFTLASRYRFNRTVRIDFTVRPGELTGLSRLDLLSLRVRGSDLPPGSVANLTRVSVVYNTERYEHGAEGRSGTNDLISPDGSGDSATVMLPLDAWERVDEQLEMRRSVDELIEHLNQHVEYYHKAIWWRMDRDRLLMLLDGFYVPQSNNVSLATVVDREPLAIIGNCVVYRVGAASFIGYGKVKTPADLYNLYAEKEPVADPVLVSLPTDGLYAQTIMDECAALEEHYGNTDWVLADKEPELGSIDPSLMTSRRSDQPATTTTPTPFPSTIINLQNAPEAPAPSGLQGALNAVTTPNAFRDMAGLAATQANAIGALNTAANLATSFGSQAAALELAKLAKVDQATRTADQKIASIGNAVKKGLATPDVAAAQVKDVLSAMNPTSPNPEPPHQSSGISAAIDAARKTVGSVIEADTPEGRVRVAVGGRTDSTTPPPPDGTPPDPADAEPLEPGRLPEAPGLFGELGAATTAPSLGMLTAYFSQWEGDSLVPPGADQAFRFGRVQSLGQQLRHQHLVRRLQTLQPLDAEGLYARALAVAGGDALLALLLCHNHTRSNSRRVGEITYEEMALPWNKVPGDSADSVTYMFRVFGDASRSTFVDRKVVLERAGAPDAVFRPIDGEPSGFYLLYDPDERFGTTDPADWYHFFLAQTIGFGIAAGKIEDTSGLGLETDNWNAYSIGLYGAVKWIAGLLRDAQPDADVTDEKFDAWLWMNALSFLEELGYGHSDRQDEVARESEAHRAGARAGILRATGGLAGLTSSGAAPKWKWFVPRAGGLAYDVLGILDTVRSEGIGAALRVGERLLGLTDSIDPYLHEIRDFDGNLLLGSEVPPGSSVPNTGEAAASGAIAAKVSRGTPEFAALVVDDNEDIVFKDEEGTGADRIMTPKLQEKLGILASYVKNAFPGRRLRVTEAWDENDEHTAGSLHYEGRAADLTIDDRDRSKIGKLGQLAVLAGFDWVLNETDHLHVSVKR